MLVRILYAIGVAFAVTLACLFLGEVVLPVLKIEIAVRTASFLVKWAAGIGVVAGVLVFARGWMPPWVKKTPS